MHLPYSAIVGHDCTGGEDVDLDTSDSGCFVVSISLLKLHSPLSKCVLEMEANPYKNIIKICI
jgi:hypothetical protein